MYRQGLGDCFLVSLPREGGKPFRLMIDCGVILGTQNAASLMEDVVHDIIDATEGFVDVLAITHEHYDHVAGFVLADHLFVRPGTDDKSGNGSINGKLRVGETWFAWTEDPGDPLARRLQTARRKRLDQLAALMEGLRIQGVAEAPLARGIGELLSFFGVSGTHTGATRQGMENARAYGGARVSYHVPGEKPWSSSELPGFRIWVLGPPRDEKLLKKTFAADEVYHLAGADALDDAFFLSSPAGTISHSGVPSPEDDYSPFDIPYSFPLPGSPGAAGRPMPAPMADFLARHYYGDASGSDGKWRRIDADWLGQGAELALQLDSATNNTSLVLAIELISSGKVLLFAADAQVGNWLSWQSLEWKLDDGTRVTGPDLLERTVFYKVGHHGSHNATLREKGLELMPNGLVAFIPVDHQMAVKKHWGQMPLPGLITALKEKAQVLVRVDEPAGSPAVVTASKTFRDKTAADGSALPNEPLYYEWSA
jgi:hypothetical protein